MADSYEALFPHPHGEQGTLADPLDTEQEFQPATSYHVRDDLQELIERDLLGPWDGEDERFAPKAMGPRDRYLVGMLGPKHAPKSVQDAADEIPEPEDTVRGDGEAELPERPSPQNLGRIWASSMGLSCAVGTDVDALHVTVSWWRYQREQTPDEDGKIRGVWYRQPVPHEREVRLDGDPDYRLALEGDDPDLPGVHLSVAVRLRDGQRVVRLVLVNAQVEPEKNKDTVWLFQPSIAVTALDGQKPVFAPVDDPADHAGAGEDLEETHLRLLYQHQRRYAVGHNVAVHAEARQGERRAWRLTTTWLPTYEVPATAAAGSGAQLSMDALASVARRRPTVFEPAHQLTAQRDPLVLEGRPDLISDQGPAVRRL